MLYKRTNRVIMLICILFITFFIYPKDRNKKNRPVWNPTTWQSELPPITLNTKGGLKEYTFVELIRADGYLCPGSARCYKTLQTALPLLFPNTTPDIIDLHILYGPSDCATRVFNFLQTDIDHSKKFITMDPSLLGREMVVQRLSTNKTVNIIYDIPAADGHDPEGASAGDLILKAEDGIDMSMQYYFIISHYYESFSYKYML